MASSRRFCAALLLVAAVFVGCGDSDGQAQTAEDKAATKGRVSTPTGEGGGGACAPGEYELRLGNGRAARLRRIDRRRLAVGGFSDGATYALSIGLQNGDIFRSVIALSPGRLLDVVRRGKPRVFIAHGTEDSVLPIRRSDISVRRLRSSGYSVTYRRFRGDHEVPTTISRAAVRWYLRR